MQILPIIVVLGGVSWMVCAVSLQGETGHKELWPTRLGDAGVAPGSGARWAREQTQARRRLSVRGLRHIHQRNASEETMSETVGEFIVQR